MAVIFEKPQTAEVEKHSSFYNAGVKVECYLLGTGPRVKGCWVKRYTKSEYKMHTIAMLRFYRLARILVTKEYGYTRKSRGNETMEYSKRSPTAYWYAHNISATFQIEVDKDIIGLKTPESDGIPIYIPILEKHPRSNDENTTITILGENGDPIHVIKEGSELVKRLRKFIDWVINVCEYPTEEIANDPDKTRAYDKMIWMNIFKALGISQYYEKGDV